MQIDYKGYRLVAMSILPINKSTLLYGSSDGGKTVYNSDLELSAKVHESKTKKNTRQRENYVYVFVETLTEKICTYACTCFCSCVTVLFFCTCNCN